MLRVARPPGSFSGRGIVDRRQFHGHAVGVAVASLAQVPAQRRRGLDDDVVDHVLLQRAAERSEEHTSELQSLMRISYAVFCLKKKMHRNQHPSTKIYQLIHRLTAD